MELKEKLEAYQELLTKKDELAEATKANNKEIDTLKSEIADLMIEEDVPKMSVGGYVFSLTDKTIYSKKSEADLQAAGLDFFGVLREQGFGDLIKETVAANSLNSAMRNLVDEAGALPEELADVLSVYDTYDITRRKETNRAIRKAKGEA